MVGDKHRQQRQGSTYKGASHSTLMATSVTEPDFSRGGRGAFGGTTADKERRRVKRYIRVSVACPAIIAACVVSSFVPAHCSTMCAVNSSTKLHAACRCRRLLSSSDRFHRCCILTVTTPSPCSVNTRVL